jgi:hypothetical protein
VKAGKPKMGFAPCPCRGTVAGWCAFVGCFGRGVEGLERLRGSIGRVRTGAEILSEENAWMNNYNQRRFCMDVQ